VKATVHDLAGLAFGALFEDAEQWCRSRGELRLGWLCRGLARHDVTGRDKLEPELSNPVERDRLLTRRRLFDGGRARMLSRHPFAKLAIAENYEELSTRP
jgi:hypothetical protein